MKVAVVGATGLVGTKMLEVLAERNFPVTELIPVAICSNRICNARILENIICLIVLKESNIGFKAVLIPL